MNKHIEIIKRREIGVPMLAAVVSILLGMWAGGVPPILRDALGYTMTAERLVVDGFIAYGIEPPGSAVKASAFVTPGYVIFLSLFYYIVGAVKEAGPNEIAQATQRLVVAAQALMAVATVGLIAGCGRLLGGRKLAYVAGFMAAAYLPFAWAATVALSESLGAMLAAAQLLLGLLLVTKGAEHNNYVFAAYGAVSGALVMVRPVLLLWAAVPFLYLLVRKVMRRDAWLKAGAVALVASALVCVPWAVRNYVVLGGFIPLSSNMGTPLFDGTGGGELTEEERLIFASATEGGADRAEALGAVARTRIWDEVRSDPWGFLVDRAERAWRCTMSPWMPHVDAAYELTETPEQPSIQVGNGPWDVRPLFLPLAGFAKFYHVVLIALALAGCFFARRSPRLLLVMSVSLYVVLVHYVTLFRLRYFFPAMPSVILLAAAGGYGLWLLFMKPASGPATQRARTV